MDFNFLKNKNTIYIVGHKDPDADSLVSAKILAEIFCFFNVSAQWVIFDNDVIDPVSAVMLKDCMAQKPKIIGNDLQKTDKEQMFYLVDHNDVSQSVQEVQKVLGAIDHHSDSGQIKNCYFSGLCCTALVIYELFKKDYPFSLEQKKQIFYAFLSDSVFGKSSRYTDKDAAIVKEMGFLTDYESYFQRYFQPTDLTDFLYAFGHNGLKRYAFPFLQLKSTYIEAQGTAKLSLYQEYIAKQQENFLGIWIDFSQPYTYAYFKAGMEWYTFEYPFIASRAATVLPQALKCFQNHQINRDEKT